MREGGDIKAFGAGILSSFGELDWMASGGAALERFDPYAKQPKMRWVCGCVRVRRRGSARRGCAAPARAPRPLTGRPQGAPLGCQLTPLHPSAHNLPTHHPGAPAPCLPSPTHHRAPSYKDGFQKRYFVLDSFQDGARLLQVRGHQLCTSRPPGAQRAGARARRMGARRRIAWWGGGRESPAA